MLKILQICNVGQITGGTSACAWSVTRALPDFAHEVWFLSKPSDETRRVFSPAAIRASRGSLSEELRGSDWDLVLFHNLSRKRLSAAPDRPSIQFLHSRIDPAPAESRVVCSEYLNQQYGGDERVMWQGVPRAPRSSGSGVLCGSRDLRREMVVGRLCTPTDRKWWPGISRFYRRLAGTFPDVRWEFVGCPDVLKEELRESCRGRACFYRAEWEARSKLWDWDVLLYHHPELPETFGRTVSEACRAGCIPVVDRTGGFIEQLEGGPGILCASGDEFEAALQLLRDQGERWKRSRGCRDWGENRFSLGAFRSRLLKEFHAVMQQTPKVNQAARR